MTVLRLIIANIAIFLVIKGVWLCSPELTEQAVGMLALPSSVAEWCHSPWSAITYMFLHIDFWHLLVNTLWLAWFGILLERIAGGRWILADYVVGGIAGAASYIMLPTATSAATVSAWLIGSSASTLAVVSATLVSIPDKRVKIPLIGSLRLKWFVAAGLGVFVCASLEMTALQVAAHAGGIMAGVISGVAWRIMTRRKMATMKAMTRERIDHLSLVEKARTSGFASLSRSEQVKLFNLSTRHISHRKIVP